MSTRRQQRPNRKTFRGSGAVVAGVAAMAVAVGVTPAGAQAGTSPTYAGGRVDLTTPTFSDPTRITNPLFPSSALGQVVQLGAEGDVALRHEVTRLDRTRVISWDGRDIEAVAVQFLAYGDGRILERATDFFAQADDGAVWYLGEEVANYENGRVADHDGSWLAGRDGPAGMLLPANPAVGDVFRPENIPGLVFEEVTVQATGLTVAGPTGPVSGAVQVQERLLDGTLENKVYAPGYGEFEARVPTSDELVTVAVAVGTDRSGSAQPKALTRLLRGARALSTSAGRLGWDEIRATSREVRGAHRSLGAGVLPPLVAQDVRAASHALGTAVGKRSRVGVRRAAIALELAALDASLRWAPVEAVDRERLEVWRLLRGFHVAAGLAAAARSDRAIIRAITAR